MVEVDVPPDALTQQQNLKSGDDSYFFECMSFYIPCMFFSSSGGGKDYVTLECGDGSDDEAEETSQSTPEKDDTLLQDAPDNYEQFAPALTANDEEGKESTRQAVTKELLEGIKAIDAQSDETSDASTIVSDVPPPPPYEGLELDEQPSDEHISLPKNLVESTSDVPTASPPAVVQKSVSDTPSSESKDRARSLVEEMYSKDQLDEEEEPQQQSESPSTASSKPDDIKQPKVSEESDDDDDDSEETGPLPVTSTTTRKIDGGLPSVITCSQSPEDDCNSDADSLPDNDMPTLPNPKDDHRDAMMEEDELDEMEPGRIRVGRPKGAKLEVDANDTLLHGPTIEEQSKLLAEEDDDDDDDDDDSCLGQIISTTTGGLYEESPVKLKLDEDFEHVAWNADADLLSDDGGENF